MHITDQEFDQEIGRICGENNKFKVGRVQIIKYINIYGTEFEYVYEYLKWYSLKLNHIFSRENCQWYGVEYNFPNTSQSNKLMFNSGWIGIRNNMISLNENTLSFDFLFDQDNPFDKITTQQLEIIDSFFSSPLVRKKLFKNDCMKHTYNKCFENSSAKFKFFGMFTDEGRILASSQIVECDSEGKILTEQIPAPFIDKIKMATEIGTNIQFVYQVDKILIKNIGEKNEYKLFLKIINLKYHK